jgi:hypothetical protein
MATRLSCGRRQSNVDRDGQEDVDREGKIKGPSSKGRDTATVLVASGGGAYIGALAGGIGALIAILATYPRP